MPNGKEVVILEVVSARPVAGDYVIMGLWFVVCLLPLLAIPFIDDESSWAGLRSTPSGEPGAIKAGWHSFWDTLLE